MTKLPVHNDGELPFDVVYDEYEKPKKRPVPLWWRKTSIPLPLLLAACLLLICSSVLLLATSTFNGSLLCSITSLCIGSTPYPTQLPTLSNDPRPPMNEVRIRHHVEMNGQTNITTEYDTTAIPAGYSMPSCNPTADYSNHLMFSMEEGDNAEIFVSNVVGSDLCRLTHNLIEEKMLDWSPDRQQILFTSTRDEGFYTDLYVMNFDGTNIRNLTQDQADDYGGVWSPDGTRIAFSSNRNSPSGQIYVMNSNGTELGNLTPAALNAQSPSWSPDGSEIAYIAGSERDSNRFEIYVVDVASKASRRITYADTDHYGPVWSPTDSRVLVYAEAPSEIESYNTDIFTFNVDDGTIQQLTQQLNAIRPTWSPDGEYAAFISQEGPRYELQILDLNTNQMHSIETGYNVRSRPIWR